MFVKLALIWALLLGCFLFFSSIFSLALIWVLGLLLGWCCFFGSKGQIQVWAVGGCRCFCCRWWLWFVMVYICSQCRLVVFSCFFFFFCGVFWLGREI